MTADSEAFETWLRREAYAETTITKIVRTVATQQAHGPIPPSSTSPRRLDAYRWAWRIWADYCTDVGKRNTLEMPPAAVKQRRRVRKRRDKPAESIPTEKWHEFLACVSVDETPAGRVIDVMCSTALRVGDVLRCSRDALERGFAREDGITVIEVKNSKPVVVCVRGGAEPEWKRLRDVCAGLRPSQLVCEVVSPDGGRNWTGSDGAAYQAVRRRCIALGEAAGIEDRMHLHRLRRTVAVQAALAGVDKFMIQKMLSHDSDKTTDLYLDEALARQVADTLGRIRPR